MKHLLLIIFALFVLEANSQSITNVVSSQQGNNAVVTYDLNGNVGTDYYVRLLYSTDNGQSFSSELKQVSGDVKGGVKAGTGKRITWAADKEVNFLNSSVIFKVEAEVKKGMPKPVNYEMHTIEVLSAKQNGDQIIVEFTIIQNTDQEVIKYKMVKSSEITSSEGKQSKTTTGTFGTENTFTKDMYSSQSFTEPVSCIKGVPVRGEIICQLEGNDKVISALKIDLLNATKFTYISLIAKNIPIE